MVRAAVTIAEIYKELLLVKKVDIRMRSVTLLRCFYFHPQEEFILFSEVTLISFFLSFFFALMLHFYDWRIRPVLKNIIKFLNIMTRIV